jgi:hypothetical protein
MAERISIWLNNENSKYLDKCSRTSGFSKSFIINEGLTGYLRLYKIIHKIRLKFGAKELDRNCQSCVYWNYKGCSCYYWGQARDTDEICSKGAWIE